MPQMWALYKEVQEYYDKGMRVPDDVTLLLVRRQLGQHPQAAEARATQPRAGGYGIYYHFDYVGGPRNYKWLNTNPIARVWEQMHLAYEYGADRLWIVNVGDIKPMEFPIEFFLDYAWNPDALAGGAAAGVHAAVGGRAIRRASTRPRSPTFSTTYTQIQRPAQAGAACRRTRTASSTTARRSGRRRVQRAGRRRPSRLAKSLPAEYQDAYFQLVLHPVKACANLNELYVTAAQESAVREAGPRGDE